MGNTMLCGKWEDLILDLSDDSIDLILTDPPYGLGYVSNIPGDKRWNKKEESESRFEKALVNDTPEEYAAINWYEFFEQCYRVLKSDSYCVLHCIVPFIGQKWEAFEAAGLRYKGTIAWRKRFAIGGDLKGTAKRDWEPILYLAKGKPTLNPLTVQRKEGKLCKSCRRPLVEPQVRERISEIEDWVFPLRKAEKRGHPTQKPQALAEQFVLWMTQEGATVLDPFAGSGTALVASKVQGRNSIGFELDEDFCKKAQERLREC